MENELIIENNESNYNPNHYGRRTKLWALSLVAVNESFSRKIILNA